MKPLLLLLAASLAGGALAQTCAFDAAGNLIRQDSSPGKPELTGPASRLVRPGTPVSLSVRATGTSLTYRWFFNQALVPAAVTDTLLITNASAAHVGDYYTIVSNSIGSATSSVARLELDADRDQLGDAWEAAQFGSLTNQQGNLDPDGDGTRNALEYLDGTSPTNRHQFRPRLVLYPVGGFIEADPNRPLYTLGDQVMLTAIPAGGNSFVGWIGDLTASTNPSSIALDANLEIQANFGLPLNQALGLTGHVFSGGRGGWVGRAGVMPGGGSACVTAPPLAGSGDAFLEATVTLALDGTASFGWRIDGHVTSQLALLVDDDYAFGQSRTLEGSTGWIGKTIFLAAGTHQLRWIYRRDQRSLQPQPGTLLPTDTAWVGGLTLTEYPDPLADADANGLPDLWEYRYFDGLGNSPDDDPDLDGVATGTELADGTDPSAKSSVVPRLTYIVEGEGTATASPAKAVYAYGELVTNTAAPAPGWSFIGWFGPFGNDYFRTELVTNNPSSDRLYQAKSFKAVFGFPPESALEAPQLPWQAGGDFPWYGQRLISWDGTNAAQCGPLLETQSQSWIETQVAGPGSLSFWWKLDSGSADGLTFLVNTVEAKRLAGRAGWQPVVYDLPPGVHTLRWRFQREYGYETDVSHTAWLDNFRFTPGFSLPEFVHLPASVLSFASSNVVLQVNARGTPPIAYQVISGGVPLTSSTTNNDLLVPLVSPALSGNWVIRASNPAGFTDSPPVPVTILAVPPNDAFAAATTLTGSAPHTNGYTFSATAQGGEPDHDSRYPASSVWYQWIAPFSGGVEAVATATNVASGLTLAVHRGTTLANLIDLAGDTAYGSWESYAPVRLTNRWAAVQGQKYYLVVDSAGAGLFFDVAFRRLDPPGNDAFANRLPLAGPRPMARGDNTLASAEPGEPPVINFPPFFVVPATRTLWWSWTAPANGTARLNTLTDATIPLLSVFTGNTMGSLTLVTNGFYAFDRLSFPAVRGVTYAISADSGYQQSGGPFTFLLGLDLDTPYLNASADPDTHRLSLSLSGAPYTNVVVQFSPNLATWYDLSTNQLDADGVIVLPPYPTTNRTRTYFRAIMP